MTDLMEALSMSLFNQDIDIYNNSWGPPDTGSINNGSRPGPLALAALEAGVTDGRDGLGSVYVWAGGNGRQAGDNINYDGYANSRFTIAVGAIDNNGVQAFYSEPGAPLIVSAYSSGNAVGITTTDLVANGSYSSDFGGTSSAAPLVAGVVALMLEANPNLGWRDVQNILIDSAMQNHPSDSDWVANGAGRLVNHKYGFGAVDAATAVDLAEGWTNLGPQVSASSGVINVGQSIPDNNALGVASSFTFDTAIDVEYVEIVFDATHTYRGDLSIVLTSPDGTQSILAEPRADSGDDYSNWVFTSARHWGESSAGQWTLTVRDLVARDLGTFNSWRINVHGTSSATRPSGFHRVDLGGGQVVNDINFGNRTIGTAPPIISDGMAGGSFGNSGFISDVAAGASDASAPASMGSPWGGINRSYGQSGEPVEGFTQNSGDLTGVAVPNYSPLLVGIVRDSASYLGVIEPNGMDDGSDLVAFRTSFNRSIGLPAFKALADWDGNGVVDSADLVMISASFDRLLPAVWPVGQSAPLPPEMSRAIALGDLWSNDVITIIEALGWPKRSINPDVIVPLVASFNSSVGAPKYNPDVDYNNDGRVDREDVVVLWQNFNRGESTAKFRPSTIVKPPSTNILAVTNKTDIHDAIFGDLDAQWNEAADGIEFSY
jgi:subtilisin-like proprotein convertase family protein